MYNSENLLKIAKRYKNSKRQYLLVNPLQAKHIPVSPSKSVEMMQTLGEKLFNLYPETKLIIGFAETATAIGAEIARVFGDECLYIHTTRENLNTWISFNEEHSHAVEQKLYNYKFDEFISQTKSIIFIDDEISTGKTLINIINQLRCKYPALTEKNIIAGSIINRVSDENMRKLQEADIKCEYLLKLPYEDFEIKNKINSPKIPIENIKIQSDNIFSVGLLENPRKGVKIGSYYKNCLQTAGEIIKNIENKIFGDILVLGTEECMYPSLVLGLELERLGKYKIRCHSTTRSPIGICQDDNYPIFEGYKIPSFYDEKRETYIYNLKHYDNIIILTDSKSDIYPAFSSICNALKIHDCGNIFLFKG